MSSFERENQRNLRLQDSLREAEATAGEGTANTRSSPLQRRLDNSLEQVAALKKQLATAHQAADLQRQDT